MKFGTGIHVPLRDEVEQLWGSLFIIALSLGTEF